MSFTAYLIICLLLLILSVLVFPARRKSNIPGPVGIPYLGQAINLINISAREFLPLLKGWTQRYGGICQIEVLGLKYVLLSEPETVEQILSSATNITKGAREYSFIKPWLRTGLVTSDGEKWRMRRKLLTPTFHSRILVSSLDGVYRNAKSLADTLLATGGKTVEIYEMIHPFSLKIICETAMGVKLNSEDKLQSEFIEAISNITDSITNRVLKFWLFPDIIYRHSEPGKTFFRCTNTVHRFSQQVILEKRRMLESEKTASQKDKNMEKGQKKAFLDTLLELDNSNPGLFSEVDIREEVDTFMFAGLDAISITIMFSLFLLANHPAVQEKAYIEQKEIFGDDERIPTSQDLQKMIYLEMVINETLRLYPVVPFYSRTLTEDMIIDDKIIRTGESVVILSYFVHRSKEHWVDPEEFIPERFTPGIKMHPFSFIPFSAGPRNCIGKKFAMIELKTLLSTILRQCRLEPVTTSVTLEVLFGIKTTYPIKVKVFPRVHKK